MVYNMEKEKTTKDSYSEGNYSYITETYDKEHKHFGGIVCASDFDTNYLSRGNMSDIAERIAADLRWEQNLIRAAQREEEYRKRGKKNEQ